MEQRLLRDRHMERQRRVARAPEADGLAVARHGDGGAGDDIKIGELRQAGGERSRHRRDRSWLGHRMRRVVLRLPVQCRVRPGFTRPGRTSARLTLGRQWVNSPRATQRRSGLVVAAPGAEEERTRRPDVSCTEEHAFGMEPESWRNPSLYLPRWP